MAKYTLSIIISSKVLIHCLYLPPSLESDQISEILSILPLDYPSTTKTIICGDLNSRMGQLTGDTRWTTSGRIVYNWMEAHDLILWNQRLAYGQPTSYTYQGTSIIDFFLSNHELDTPSLVIRDDLSLSSNHTFMTLSFTLPSTHLSHHLAGEIARPHWHLKKLKKLVFRDRYRDTFGNNISASNSMDITESSTALQDFGAARAYIEQFSTQLCQNIYTSLDQICGKRDIAADVFLKQFWTTEMTSAFNLKQFYYKKWRKANGLNCLNYWLKHQETDALLRRLIQQRRRQTWRQFCDKMSKGEYTKAIARLSRIRKNRTIKPSFSPDPSITRAPADVMADHFRGIFAGQLLTPSSNLNPPPYYK